MPAPGVVLVNVIDHFVMALALGCAFTAAAKLVAAKTHKTVCASATPSERNNRFGNKTGVKPSAVSI